MKKTVVIVEPASNTNVFSFFSYMPLLGTLYLGTILKNNGFDVRVKNENLLKRGVGPCDLDADFLLLSCLTPTVTRGYEIARQYKQLRPDGKVIIGGPHVSFMKDEAAEYADHVVIGEGEGVIADLLKYGSSEKFIYGTAVADLDNLPFIDWSVLGNTKKPGLAPIMTSRGCPFNCNFCSVAEMFGRKYRAMSPDRVLEEVERVDNKWIFFYDDNLTANTARAHQIMDKLISLKTKRVKWTAQVRSDVVKDVELTKKMARAGCDRVYIGFESINPKTLKTFKKSQTPQDISNAIQILHNFGIKVHGMFIYGSDSDDHGLIYETEVFVKKTHIDTVQYMILTPFPGTEIFRRLEAEGRLIHRNWQYYDALHVVFWPENFSPIKLQELAIDSFKGFYSLANATNEIVNMFATGLTDNIKRAINIGQSHTYSFKNALFRAGGKFILNKWNRINKSYFDYLHQLGDGALNKCPR